MCIRDRYGLDVTPVGVSDMRALEFAVKRVMIELFKTCDNNIINSCMLSCGLPTVRQSVEKRQHKFLVKCNSLDNLLCKVVSQ